MNMNTPMTFYDWITKFSGQKDIRGDMAKLIIQDPSFPRNVSSYAQLKQYYLSIDADIREGDIKLLVLMYLWDDYTTAAKLYRYSHSC